MRRTISKTSVAATAIVLFIFCCATGTPAQRTNTQPTSKPKVEPRGRTTDLDPKLEINKTPPTKSVPAGPIKIDTGIDTIPLPDLIVSDIAYTKAGLSDNVTLMVLVENQGTSSSRNCKLWVRLNKPIGHKTFQDEFITEVPLLGDGEKKWIPVAIGNALTKETSSYEKIYSVTAIIDAEIYPSEELQAIIANQLVQNKKLIMAGKKPFDGPQYKVTPSQVTESNEKNNERTVALDKIKPYQP